ncbi:CPBP family intramembrane glutamic endopeptidase [Leucobacter insecticola]
MRSQRRGSDAPLARYSNQWTWMLPVTGAAEEIIFRGSFLFGLLAAGFDLWVSIVVSAMLFGLVHVFQYGRYGVVLHTMTGVVFGVLATQLDLSAAMISHATFNLLVVTMGRRRPCKHTNPSRTARRESTVQ